MSDDLRAEVIEWQRRTIDLENSVERLREERDAARSSVDLLMAETSTLEEKIREQAAIIDRLRLHLQQGVEL